MKLHLLAGLIISASAAFAETPEIFQPRGRIHIPIGVPNTLDTLKTFVEAEGNFSPGFGSYGIFFAVEDPATGKVTSPTHEGIACTHGLAPGGLPIPWSEWGAGDVEVRTEVCEVKVPSPAGEVFVAAARVRLTNRGAEPRSVALRVQLQSLGAAGGPVKQISAQRSEVHVEGRPALVYDMEQAEGPITIDPASGEARVTLRWKPLTLAPDEARRFGFIWPVLPGRRAVGHRWDRASAWAQLDLADPISGEGGVLQPDPGVEFYTSLKPDALFAQAEREWRALVGKVEIKVPDQRWNEAFAAITAHAMLAMNEGAPDVAAINYNVFNRDGVYVASMLHKSGNFDLAAACIDYFLAHPFNGRVEPEADNPGQVLWILGEHWRFTRDRAWLERVYPAVKKLAAMITYYRTTPEPHWVNADSLDFGDALPPEKRQRLKPGACDGFHPEYTEAFDIAGMRAAAELADALGRSEDRSAWATLALRLMGTYDERFGADLRKHEYANYSVLWPCRVYPLTHGHGWEQFRHVGAQQPTSWRYFPLARAHQGFLAGNRAAAHGTLAIHLDHEQMRGWYAFDEGGPSGPGNWMKVRSNWKVERKGGSGSHSAAAMPHGWAIAELHLLLRDALVYEDGGKLILFAGIPPEWFRQPLEIRNLPTYFGTLDVKFVPSAHNIRLELGGNAAPREGVILRMPQQDFALKPGQKVLQLD